MNIGECPTFNPQTFLDAARQLVDADEVERALQLLENVPAFYRDNMPLEILRFKNEILSYMLTPHGYINDNHDNKVNTPEQADWFVKNTLRGILLQQEVSQNPGCHVLECGPGEYGMPIGLQGEFTYWDIALDKNTQSDAQNIIYRRRNVYKPGQIGIFVANEIIEHLPEPRDLAVECYKHFKDNEPHYIQLSTPLYTYDPKPKDWSSHKLPHLRAYTPREFIMEAQRLWPHYEWQLYMSPIMSLRGVHPNANFKEHLKV